MGARHPRSGPHLAPAENGAAKSPPVTPTSAAAGCHCACALHPAHPAPSAENTDPGPWSCDGRGASGLRLYRRMVVSLAALSPLPRCSYPAKAQRAAKLGALRVGSRGVSAGAKGPVCSSPSSFRSCFQSLESGCPLAAAAARAQAGRIQSPGTLLLSRVCRDGLCSGLSATLPHCAPAAARCRAVQFPQPLLASPA